MFGFGKSETVESRIVRDAFIALWSAVGTGNAPQDLRQTLYKHYPKRHEYIDRALHVLVDYDWVEAVEQSDGATWYRLSASGRSRIAVIDGRLVVRGT
jgi:hypothetical protein